MNITREELMMPADEFKLRVRKLRQQEDASRQAKRDDQIVEAWVGAAKSTLKIAEHLEAIEETPCPTCRADDPISGSAHCPVCRHTAPHFDDIDDAVRHAEREAELAGAFDEDDEGGEE